MDEQHAGRAADCASAMAAAAGIVSEKHFPAAASVLLPVAGFDLQCAGKYNQQLASRGRVPVLIRGLRASPSPSCSAPAAPRSGGRYGPRRRSTHCRPGNRSRQIANRHRVRQRSGRFSSRLSERRAGRRWYSYQVAGAALGQAVPPGGEESRDETWRRAALYRCRCWRDPAAIREFAQTAEEIGYQDLAAPDHVLGVNVASRPDWGDRNTSADLFHDPFVLFGFLAGCTRNIEFSTQVLILAQRQAVLVAKQAASLDVLCGGRFRSRGRGRLEPSRVRRLQ